MTSGHSKTLADHIRDQRGSEFDHGEALTTLARGIDDAQRFVIGDDIMSACYSLMHTKPSTMLSALPLCRLPYKTMWVEYRGGLGPPNTREAPIPALQGFLIEGLGDTDFDRRGLATVAWMHAKHSVVDKPACFLTPFAIFFDWRPDGDVRELVTGFHKGLVLYWSRLDPALGRILQKFVDDFDTRFFANTQKAEMERFMVHRTGWKQFAYNEREIEALIEGERHLSFGLSGYGVNMLLEVTLAAAENNNPEGLKQIMRSWLADIQGEGMILETLLVMLNSRNVVQHEVVDLSRLNKARKKHGKGPLLGHTRTTIALSRSMHRVATARGMTHETARQHLVRGHFKIRRTGVFWWSPFVRGDAAKGKIAREEYEVT